MNQISLTYIRHSDGQISGLHADGLTDSQLRYYALEAGFGVVGNPETSSVFIGSRRHIEQLFVVLEMSGYNVLADVYEIAANPFATGSTRDLVQMILDRMDVAGDDSALLKMEADAMLTPVMRALGWLHSKCIIDLDASAIRDHLSLDRVIDLFEYPGLPTAIRKCIWSYLSCLPPDCGQPTSQHAFLQQQIAKALDSFEVREAAR